MGSNGENRAHVKASPWQVICTCHGDAFVIICRPIWTAVVYCIYYSLRNSSKS